MLGNVSKVVYIFSIIVILFVGLSNYLIPDAEAKDLKVEDECINQGLEVVITDEQGNPLWEARVGTISKMSSGSYEYYRYTDENGYVLIPHSELTGFIKISKGGYNDIKMIVSCTSVATNEMDGFLTYHNPLGNINIKYPPNWSSIKSQDPAVLAWFNSPFEDAYDTGVEKVIVGLYSKHELSSLNEWVTIMKKELPEFYLDVNIVEVSDVTLSNYPAKKIVYTRSIDGIADKLMTILTIVDKTQYYITYIAQPAKFSTFLPTVEKMIDSFEILPPTNFQTYSDPNFDFKIDYPSNWDYDDDFIMELGIIYPIGFYDDIDEYHSFFDVRFVENDIDTMFGTDQQKIELLTYFIEGLCESYSFETVGYTCEDLEILYSRTRTVNEQTVYDIKYSWIETFPDYSYYEVINIVRTIPAKEGIWTLYSETTSEKFSLYENNILHMLDSFTLPESQLIPKSGSSDSKILPSGEYVNEKYGFSVMYPKDWKIGIEDLKQGDFFVPVSFHQSSYSGLFPPAIMTFYFEDEEFDLSTISKKELEDEFKDGLLKETSQEGHNFEITFENYEIFDNSVKISVRANLELNSAGVLLPMKMEIVAWGDENGKTHAVFYLTDEKDFEKYYPDFRTTLNSFTILSDSPIDLEDELPAIPEWVRNNAKWWSDDLITDSDFTAGIEYLIKIDAIDVQSTTSSSSGESTIPSWVKSNAEWWADGQISDQDFLKGVEFLVEKGIIHVDNTDLDLSDSDNL